MGEVTDGGPGDARGGGSTRGGGDASGSGGGIGGGMSASGGGGTSAAGGGGMSASGGGGTSASGGGGGTQQTFAGTSDMPIPVGPGNVPQPSGSGANLQILNWAGFKGAGSYTFDDGLGSQVAHWADLKATGARGTLYLIGGSTPTTGRDATWRDARDAGWELGNHTKTHCNFGDSNCNNYSTEYDPCTSYIENGLGATVTTAAYPFCALSWEPGAKSRFFLGRGCNAGTIGPNDNTDPWALPAWTAQGNETAQPFSDQLDAVRSQGRWVIFLVHSLLPGQNEYAGVPITSITGSISHGQQLGDVWLDSVANVGAYWVGQKLLKGASPSSASGVTTWTWTLPAHFPTGRFLRVTVNGGVLKQNGQTLPWNAHGFYEVSLDVGSLAWAAQ